MDRKNCILVRPTKKLKAQFLEMAADYETVGDTRYQSAVENFDVYVKRMEMFAAGKNLPPGRVQSSEFFLLSDGRLIGRGNLRHRLNSELEMIGGNIGYDVRPSERKKGFGTLILRLTLEKAREIGLERVLLTCDADNIASAKIIEKNGGKLARQIITEQTEKLISRYWIEL